LDLLVALTFAQWRCQKKLNGKVHRPTILEQSAVYHVRHNYKTLLFGQLLSAEFVLASTGAAQATLHLNCDLSAPTFTIGIIYFAFCRFII
jgi:hypothetical protein